MTYDYFVRITHSYDKIASLVSLWACRSEKLVVYEHIGTETEKVHCHILILGSNTQKKQLRNIGATCVPLKGNELCSFKECVSWETPVVYMSKGNLDPKYLKGFERSDADEWKAKWVAPSEYEKVSSDVRIVEKFWTDHRLEQFNNLVRPETEPDINRQIHYKFYWICKQAYAFLFGLNSYVWNMKTRNQYYMLVMTIATRQSIPIPRNHKFAEIL